MPSPISSSLTELRRQYADQLCIRLDTIRLHFQKLSPSSWQTVEAETLYRLVHNLTGSAGTLGMQSVSAAARELELQLSALLKADVTPAAPQWEQIGAAFAGLEEIAREQLLAYAPEPAQPPVSALPSRSPLIYLLEDDGSQTEEPGKALRDDGYRVKLFTQADDFRDALCAEDTERPAGVIIDNAFPEGEEIDVSLLAALGLGSSHGIPVVITSERDDLAGRLACFRAGASRYLTSPVDPAHLIDLMDSLTGRQPPEPYRVLLVDDEPLLLEKHADVLRKAGMQVISLSEPLHAIEQIDVFSPDVVILDVYMPEVSGLELAAVLRERDPQFHIPVLFLSAETDITQQLLALNLGGNDFLVKPVQPEYLVALVTARARQARQNTNILRRMESTLYEREREHHALNQHAIVSIADKAGNITYVNDRFCEISGYRREELLGHSHRRVKSNVHPPGFYKNIWQTITSGHVWQGEICNRRKDGSLYWVESTITPFLDSHGKPYQYVSIRTDISHVKAAELAMQTQEERLRRSQVFANIGTWDWDIQTDKLFWSERIAPLFGYPEGELATSYDNFIEAIHPDDRQTVINTVKACVEKDIPYEIEHRVVWPDGTVRWLLERGASVRDKDGSPLQMLGVVQDIDDRKRAELALAERERQLNEAQAISHLGSWQADLVTGQLNWSDEIYRIFGYEPGSFEPSVAAFHAAVHPDDHERVRESEEQSQQTGRHDVIHRILRPDGTVRHVHELAQAETDAAGNLLRLSGTVQDITERVKTEQALITARDEAERANRAKSEFLSSMSHELRTPMNAILGFSQLLEHDDTLDEDQVDSVREILNAGHHLLELIDEVLDLSRIESGRLEVSLEPVEVCPVVRECLGLVANMAHKRSIQLSHHGLDGVVVQADRTRLKQILINLFSNAIKYNHEGGSVKVEVKPATENRLRILVTDTGPGIADTRLDEVFAPFNRLGAENSEVEGTGIGLTISRRLIETMGGSVDVESKLGTGSTFSIVLPLEIPADT